MKHFMQLILIRFCFLLNTTHSKEYVHGCNEGYCYTQCFRYKMDGMCLSTKTHTQSYDYVKCTNDSDCKGEWNCAEHCRSRHGFFDWVNLVLNNQTRFNACMNKKYFHIKKHTRWISFLINGPPKSRGLSNIQKSDIYFTR